jgi:GxxExxY protein
MAINDITGNIVDSCIKIHKQLGPGLFESVYEEVLYYELLKRNFNVERQVPVPVYYDQLKMGVGFRSD